ncbi:LOW QUALITY PROTEIN: Reverse transcriptase precursor, partial [Phytophthora megakarya]
MYNTFGPDDLGNERYLEHFDSVAPILTTVFNNSYSTGVIPRSFAEAFIFVISKGGDTSQPLNYRPIVLLNSDYKILTRVLAWRVRRHITKLVHRTQFGFTPGRTIHDTMVLFEAAKAANVDIELKGIPVETNAMDLVNIAGKANDTVIFILERTMQPAVIQAVDRFLRVSGLRLNVKKSTVVRLGNGHYRAKNEDTKTRRHTAEKIAVVKTK